MNIVNTLTLRHIKTHKKRSILTIMAIIVSVAMVTAVFTSALSFVKYFQNASKAIDGNWHAYFTCDNYYDNKDAFEKDADIEAYGVNSVFAFGKTEAEDDYSLEIDAVDRQFLDIRNIKISQGTMPKNQNELLVHKKYIENNKLAWKVGDIIELPCINSNKSGAEELKSFKIAGITESNVSQTDAVSAYTVINDDVIKKTGEVTVLVRYNKLDNSVWDKIEKTGKASNSTDYAENRELLQYSGVMRDNYVFQSLGGFCAIILVIIAIVSIFMIYDSFAVSYQERAKYLGMLASVGATKKQKRQSIYFEGFILGLIAIPLGVLAGIGGIAITFKGISSVWIDTLGVEYDKTLSVSVNWIIILGTVIVSAATIFVSSYIPALKASKTSAIDAIKQANTVKVKNSKGLKTSKLATKLFGYEGALAVKNFKRNGRRSRTIVFSLFMSVVVFLSVANFSLMFGDVMKQTYSLREDLTVTINYEQRKQLEKALENTPNIKDCFIVCDEYASFDEKLIDNDAKRLINNNQVSLAFVDNNTFDSYLQQLGEDPAKYHDLNNPTAILHNSVISRDGKKKVKIEPFVDMTGKNLEMSISVFNADPSVDDSLSFAPVIGIQTTKDFNNDAFYYQNMHIPLVLLSIDFAPQVFDPVKDKNSYGYSASVFTDDAEGVENYLWETAFPKVGINEATVFNSTAQMQSMNNILTIVKVFVFGFITLITLISIMNIINTISNAMNERRREFAMIRSIGLTPGGFKKMIYYESFRYGVKALAFAIPISIAIHYFMYYALSGTYDYGFVLHPQFYFVAIIAVFVIISIALLYSISKIKDDNIIETLKQDIG